MPRFVEVQSYQTDWPARFKEEAAALEAVFGDLALSFHHFGSTAVPGLSAKPIIDILVIVSDIDAVDELIPKLQELGYHAVGEYGIPGRRFFYKGTSDLRSHHLHAYQSGDPQILRHLAFRDYMRAHPKPALEYAHLKEKLARLFPEDMDHYIAGKDAFVKEHEKRAMEWYREPAS